MRLVGILEIPFIPSDVILLYNANHRVLFALFNSHSKKTGFCPILCVHLK